MLSLSASTPIARLIERLAQRAGKAELAEAQQRVGLLRPVGYVDRIAGLRRRYEGRGGLYVDAALRRRYPLTHDKMPRSGLNWLRMIASQDAAIYADAADRWIEVGGERVSDGDLADAFADAVARSGLDSTMAEAERVAACARTVLVRGLWVRAHADDVGAPAWRIYWPSDVGLAFDDGCVDFSSLDRCVLLVASHATPDPSQRAWEVFSREHVVEDGDDAPRFGAWRRVVLLDDGRQIVAPHDWPGERLPFAICHVGAPHASPWIDEDHDLPDVVDDLNVSRINEIYTLDMQGHSNVALSGPGSDDDEIVAGPDGVWRLAPATTATVIDHRPKLNEMHASRKLALRELAAAREQSPDAYAVEPGPPMSGVSRRIANIPADRRARRARAGWIHDEEQQILPILLDLLRTFGGVAIPVDAVARMQPAEAADYEEPEAMQRRLQAEVDAGWISPARAAVEAGRYADMAEAVEAGVSDKIKGAGGATGLAALFASPGDGAQEPEPARETTLLGDDEQDTGEQDT